MLSSSQNVPPQILNRSFAGVCVCLNGFFRPSNWFLLPHTSHLSGQADALNILGIIQWDVSHLMRGHFSRFTTDNLRELLKRLGCRVKRGQAG